MLERKRLVGQSRVAGAQDGVGAEAFAELGLQRLANVELGDDAETLLRKRLARGGQSGVER